MIVSMNLATALLFTASLLAQAPPITFGVPITRGTTTILPSRQDLSVFGGLFAFDKANIQLILRSTNPLTTDFEVTITTQDAEGNVHTYSDHTAASVRSSLLLFPTDDTVLLSVMVREKGVIAQTHFDGT